MYFLSDLHNIMVLNDECLDDDVMAFDLSELWVMRLVLESFEVKPGWI